jgi:hypothetical protein
MTTERERIAGFGRLEDGLRQSGPWYQWGPYPSERQRGTVREDYSSRGYRWASTARANSLKVACLVASGWPFSL